MNYKPRNTASTQKGKGDSYGNAIKQKIGRKRNDIVLVPVTTPPPEGGGF